MKKAFSFSASLAFLLVFTPSLQAEEKKLLTPAEMLQRLQAEDGDDDSEEEGASEVLAWPEALPKDLPLYPGVSHQPVSLGVPGYYRWNIQAPSTDRAKIIETIRQGETNGWKLTTDQKQSENIHLLQFSRGDQHVVVTVSNDGVETKTVFYEFMKASKRR